MWQTVEPMTNDKEKNCKKTVDEDAAGRDVEQKERSYLKPTTRRPQTNVKVIKTYMTNALYLSVNLFSTKVLIGDTIIYSIFFS